jgi:hypothetical protein
MHSEPGMNTWTTDELARVYDAVTALNASHNGIIPLDRLAASSSEISGDVLRSALETLERADLVDLMIDQSWLNSRVRLAGHGWMVSGRGWVAYAGVRR